MKEKLQGERARESEREREREREREYIVVFINAF